METIYLSASLTKFIFRTFFEEKNWLNIAKHSYTDKNTALKCLKVSPKLLTNYYMRQKKSIWLHHSNTLDFTYILDTFVLYY